MDGDCDADDDKKDDRMTMWMIKNSQGRGEGGGVGGLTHHNISALVYVHVRASIQWTELNPSINC